MLCGNCYVRGEQLQAAQQQDRHQLPAAFLLVYILQYNSTAHIVEKRATTKNNIYAIEAQNCSEPDIECCGPYRLIRSLTSG